MPTRSALSVLTLLTLALTACGGGGTTTTPQPQPQPQPETNLPSTLTLTGNTGTLTVPGGYALSTDASWLSLSTPLTTTSATVTMHAAPLDGLDRNASQPELRAVLTARGSSGTQTVDVRRPLNRVTGQISAATTAALSIRQATAPALSAQGAATQEVIVTYRAGLSSQSLRSGQPFLQAQTLQALGGAQALAATSRTQLLRVTNVPSALNALRTDPNVLRAEPNLPVHAAGAAAQPGVLPQAWLPGDELAPAEWNYGFLNYAAVQADQPRTYPNSVTVAVLDTGVQTQHPDLDGQLHRDGALNFAAGAAEAVSDPGDQGFSHGTAVAGAIAAKRHGPGAGTGLVGGVTDANVKLLNLRVLNADGSGDMFRAGLAIRYAAGESVTLGGVTYTNPHPARVINLSLGGNAAGSAQPAICADVAAATALGALVVASAGNDGSAARSYPASCPDAVSVGALTLDAQRHFVPSTYSQANDRVTLAAPGGSDWDGMTYNNGLSVQTSQGTFTVPDALPTTGWDYSRQQPEVTFFAGTSAAAPVVSAVAALMFAKGVVTTPQAARERLIATANDVHDLGRDAKTGAGVINPVAALGIAANQAPAAALLHLTMGGKTFSPAVGADLRFTAFLPGGDATLTLTRDTNRDGQVSAGEAQRQLGVQVTEGQTSDLGTLTLP